MRPTINPEDIREETSVRELKRIRKKLKKNRNQPFAAGIIKTRIQQLQHQFAAKTSQETARRIARFLHKVSS